jgi:hypothetical protein
MLHNKPDEGEGGLKGVKEFTMGGMTAERKSLMSSRSTGVE